MSETIKINTTTVDAKEVKEVEITSTNVRKIPADLYLKQLEARKTNLTSQLAKVNEDIATIKE